MTDEEVRRPARDLLGEVGQCQQDVLGTPDGPRSGGPAGPGQVGVDPPEPWGTSEQRLEAGLGLAVVDPRAVEDENESATAVLDAVDDHAARPDLHPGTLAPAPVGRSGPAGHDSRPSTSAPRRRTNAATTTRKTTRMNLAPRATAVRAPR